MNNKTKIKNPKDEFSNDKIQNSDVKVQGTSENNSQTSISGGNTSMTINQVQNGKNVINSSNINGKSNNKKKKKKPKKVSDGGGNSTANSGGLENTNGNSVKKTGNGSQISADNYEDKSVIATGNTINVGGITEKSINLVGYAVHGSGSFTTVNYDVMNKNPFDSSSFNNNLINYSRGTKDAYNLKNILGIRKDMKIFTYPTLALGYQQEEYDVNRDYYSMYFLNPFGEDISKLIMPVSPTVNAINYVMGFNVSGHFPTYNPFLKEIKKTVEDGVTNFEFKEDKDTNLCYLGEKISIPFNKLTADEAIKKGSGQRHLIGGHDPYKDKEGEFKVTKHKINYNSKRIKKAGKDIILNDNIVTDCGTWRVVQSNKQFIENFVNAVLNDPDFSKVAGLTKHTRVLLHAHSTLAEMGTIGRIIGSCIIGALNNMPFIGKKLGKLDTTSKYFYTAAVNTDLRNGINRFLAVISKFPYNKKIVDDFNSISGLYLANNKDPYDAGNPVISLSTIISGVFEHFKYYDDPFKTEVVRDNMSSPSIVIPIGPLAKSLFGKFRKFMPLTAGFHKKGEFDASRVMLNLKDSAAEAAVQGTDLDDVANYYVLNRSRMTAILLNQLKTIFGDTEFIEKLEEYSRKVSLFLSIYSSDKILSDTDYAVDIIQPLDWFTISEENIKQFPHKHLIQSLGLGHNNTQIDMLSADTFEDDVYIPSWYVRAGFNDENVTYQNMLGYIITEHDHKELEVSFSDFVQDYSDSVKAHLKMKSKLYQVNFLDATFLPLVADIKHIALGWNDGVIAHGERYEFDSGVLDNNDFVSWGCSVFEYTIAGHTTLISDSLKSSVNIPANAVDGGYFVSQTMMPFINLSSQTTGLTIAYSIIGFDNWPLHYYLNISSDIDLVRDSKPYWLIGVKEIFRNDIFRGLSAMAGGVPYAELPTLQMCDLVLDRVKSGSGN